MDEETRRRLSNPRSVRGARVLAVAFAATLAVAACGGDDDDRSNVTVPETDDDTTTTTTRRSTTTTTADPEATIKAEVEQAYYDQWDAFVEIFANPDPTNPLIDEYFTGRAREQVLNSIASEIQNGTITSVPEDPDAFRPTVESISLASATEAVVVECLVDGLLAVDRHTGEVLDDDVVAIRTSNTFILNDGRWRISETTLLEELPEGALCDT